MAKKKGRRRRQRVTPRKVDRHTAGPGLDHTISGEGQHDVNSMEVKSQFWDEDCSGDADGHAWDQEVKKYVDSVSDGRMAGVEAVVHDSGWRKKNGRRMRLVLVEAGPKPAQRQWVSDIMKRALRSE